MYEHITDGNVFLATERSLNGGKLGPRKPFPLGVYVDDTGVTQDGKKTAKPVFAFAGDPSLCVPILGCLAHHHLL